MMATAEKTDPALWDQVKAEVTKGTKGGKAGQWSARKAQLATHEYQERGGDYVGGRSEDNSLSRWTEEDWGTKSGRDSDETGERYLPRKAREHLTDAAYRRTTAKKRSDTRKGLQFSAQPADIAKTTAQDRKTAGADGRTKAELYAQAKRRGIAGRSKLSKAELAEALA
ncbi:hypothetical protein ASG43_19300 [Aureimonas sp. Leaf454]|uniref:DUF5872 domain-containing protein n=1 Tax=Aureimonas sp. Leaf454 TaxID=1736381 RepID=UPI0006FA8A2E|nr:DUF5872 domain-containing protein [Aureimonas sp. Leaf454]KQT53128.1 hypothetical protein ASG43_19300 [Aureimonas sp. Leaf454]